MLINVTSEFSIATAVTGRGWVILADYRHFSKQVPGDQRRNRYFLAVDPKMSVEPAGRYEDYVVAMISLGKNVRALVGIFFISKFFLSHKKARYAIEWKT